MGESSSSSEQHEKSSTAPIKIGKEISLCTYVSNVVGGEKSQGTLAVVSYEGKDAVEGDIGKGGK